MRLLILVRLNKSYSTIVRKKNTTSTLIWAMGRAMDKRLAKIELQTAELNLPLGPYPISPYQLL
jgi:hypothetical protein